MRTPKRNPKGSSDLRSHPVAMLLLLRKKRGEKARHAQNLLPIRATSGRVTVTSGRKVLPGRIWRNFRLRMRRTYFRTWYVTDVTSVHGTYGNAQWSDPPQMLTELYPYTTPIYLFIYAGKMTSDEISLYYSRTCTGRLP